MKRELMITAGAAAILGVALAVCSAAAQAQVSSNQSLKGNYYFRQLALVGGGVLVLAEYVEHLASKIAEQ